LALFGIPKAWLSASLLGIIGLGLWCEALAEARASEGGGPKIAIIIDDLGYDRRLGEAALAVPGAMTYAFLPHTPYARELAERAHEQDKQVMLHLPMESHRGDRLGMGGLTLDMPKARFLQTLDAALASVPHAAGVNNHMGSLLTRDPTAMRWLMSDLRGREMFFIDSRTTAKSLAEKVARKQLVGCASRQVFLDNETDREKIHRQFQRLIESAKHNGSAIAIGHPHTTTLAVLAEQVPKLAAQGVELVHASELTTEGRNPWHAYSSPWLKDVKSWKRLPSPIY